MVWLLIRSMCSSLLFGFNFIDTTKKVGFDLALPNCQHPPTFGLQGFHLLLVPGLVAVELRLPELGVGLGEWQITKGAAMPVAAVDEDGQLAPRIHDVRAPRSLLPVQPVPT